MMAVLALKVAYDGFGFVGSQLQAGSRTVQGELDAALAKIIGQPEPTVFAGRTDRGVHAVGQVVSLADGRADLPLDELRAAIGAYLAEDLSVVDIERRPDGFHARYDATWREYRYRVWSGPYSPLPRHHVWQRRADLDTGAMRSAAQSIVGERDFAALAGLGQGVPWSSRNQRTRGTVRRVLTCDCYEVPSWWDAGTGHLLEIRVIADGFLPRMVRNLVGGLVEIGRGRQQPTWLLDVVAGGDRRNGIATAPAHGLTLWRVGYASDRIDDEPGGQRWTH